MKPLMITMMQALGDATYQRPFVRAQSQVREVYVDSPWPETYRDLPNVRCVMPRTRYRAPAKNIARLAAFPWATAPHDCQHAAFHYILREPGSICADMERYVGLAGRPFVFDLPDFGPSPMTWAYAVIRPVSVRTDWVNVARNPEPEYIAQAARLLNAAGYTVVCVADLSPGAETLEGEMPEADVYWTAGELAQPALFALIRDASVVVGGSGWIVPTALAYRTPAIIIGGGQGQHNAPERLVDPRMHASRMRFILPEPQCMCGAPRHPCRKEIPNFAQRFEAALDAVTSVEVAA